MNAPSGTGLDRARIDANGKIQHLSTTQNSPRNDSGFEELEELDEEGDGGARDDGNENAEPLSKRKRFAVKTKRILHIGGESPPKIEATAPVLADAPDTVSNSRLVHPQPEKEEHTSKELLKNPIDTIKSKVSGQGGQQVASNLVAKEISHGQEVELVRAQDEVLNAKTDAAKALAMDEVDTLVKRRQDVFLRWTMDRHVTKVRILPHATSKKERKDFIISTADGNARTDWAAYGNHLIKRYAERYGGEYIGATSDPPPPTKEVLMPSIERLLVASAPLQTFMMTMRHIYRWENPKETGVYLVAYAFLWVSDLILPGILLSMLYLLIHRYLAAPTIEDLRKDIERTENVTQVALTLSEFIQKEGDEAWLDPLIEAIGPWALVQLSDLANFMEVLRNFYEWRVPSRTGATAALLALITIGITFTPAWLLLRSTTLILGIVFFGLFPIGSYFPDYRYLASPLKWMFWKIPTHAEWSIKALQDEASRNKPNTTTSTSSPATEPAYGSYSAKLDTHFGKLILSASGIRFESSIGHKVHFSLNYDEISRLEKLTRHVQKALSQTASGEDLRFVEKGGGGEEKEWVLRNVEERDQAFSQIVGFASVKWQVVW